MHTYMDTLKIIAPLAQQLAALSEKPLAKHLAALPQTAMASAMIAAAEKAAELDAQKVEVAR